MNQDNNNLNNILEQSINNQLHQQTLNQYNAFNTPGEEHQTKSPKKKINTKLIIIVVIILIAVIGTILLPKLFNGSKSNGPVVVNSTFEKNEGYYVLQDENGKVLLSNIKKHGNFCNGTTEVQNTNGEYGIVDGNGKLIVEYGKYSSIEQYSSWSNKYYCFYEVTEKNNNYQKMILKYDGSILYSNKDDRNLRDVDLNVYESTNKFVLFETKEQYQFLNYLGEPFFTLNKKQSIEEPTILSNDGEYANEKYLSIYYDGKTYIYNLDTFKLAFNVFNGEYWIKDRHVSSETTSIAGIDINTKESESLIIFGYPNPDNKKQKKTYLVEKGKITFETDKCLNAYFVGINDLNCLIQNGGPFEKYDINGNKINN